MLIFKRTIENKIKERLHKGRAILIFGPRQAGKTTLSKKILEAYGKGGEYFNCELSTVRKNFEVGKPELLKGMIGDKKIVVFDEAQTIEDIGAILKSFIDTYPDIQIIATGSSSFDLANKINEPLTGRAFEFILYPLSIAEIMQTVGSISMSELHDYMRLGTYPAVVAEKDLKIKEDLLKNLATNYLYKDVYTFESIRNPRIFKNLIKMLALQIGSLVSVNELALSLGVSRATVEKYIKLLEQSYVIKIIRPYSRNPRNEIKKAFKIYFIDTGVRNAVIDNVSMLNDRQDKGALFENFFIMERFKINSTEAFPAQVMFWRTRTGEEIDVVEELEGKISVYECKWNNEKQTSFDSFLKKYPEAKTQIVSPEDLL
jgi:predicted AAA+ superfamily ATPase